VSFIVLLVLLLLILLIVQNRDGSEQQDITLITATYTPEPILPSRTPARQANEETPPPGALAAAPTAVPTMTNTIVATTVPSPTPVETSMPVTLLTAEIQDPSLVTSELSRFGVGIASNLVDAQEAQAAGLRFGSALAWNVWKVDAESPFEFWQMVRVNEQGLERPGWAELDLAITNHPNSFWLIGNEPDVKWQDNVTPQAYAEIYHELYNFIKERDPSARVVIGGVSQPTPLRRAYLDIVLDTYEATHGVPMPVDVWNVHAFILREEAGSWGVDIPPGMEGEKGILYEIDDHDDLDILEQNIYEFRAWMNDRGYGGAPLVVSEYGILMPEDYGFPLERLSAFLLGTFDLFQTMSGDEGYAPDENRLVQWWFWYSLYDGWVYPTGNLWDVDAAQMTGLGEAWSGYIIANEIAP
jgi:hypothetical protein